MARNTQNRQRQHLDAPPSSRILTSPADTGLSFELITEMQRELFRTSGPQTPKRQRKKERKEAYMRWLDGESRRQLERATEIATKRSERRMAKATARAAKAAKAAEVHSSQHSPRRRTLTQGPSAPMPASIGDHGVPNRPEPRPEPPPKSSQEPSGDKPVDPIPTSLPETTPPERTSHSRRVRTGFRGWLKNRLGL